MTDKPLLNETQFETKLLDLIAKLKTKAISNEEFCKLARDFVYKTEKVFHEFEDEELGWAKYWIEETNYYGCEEVMKNKFDFLKLAEIRIN